MPPGRKKVLKPRKPAPKGYHWAHGTGAKGETVPKGWSIQPNPLHPSTINHTVGSVANPFNPQRTTKEKYNQPAQPKMTRKEYIQQHGVAGNPQSYRKAAKYWDNRHAGRGYGKTASQISRVGAKIPGSFNKKTNVKPAGSQGSTHVAHTSPGIVTTSAGAHKAAPSQKVVRSQKKGKGKVAINRSKGGRQAPRAAQGQAGAPTDAGNPYGIPEMPDFFSQVQPIPSYEDLQGAGGPSVEDLMAMVQGGGGGGNYTTSGMPSTTTTYPGTAGGSVPVANTVDEVARNLTGALGGAANQGTGDSLQYAKALSEGIPSSFPTAGTAGYTTSTGGGGGGSSGGRSTNPYTAAAALQKMFQAEQMFGPKLMAQFLKNQGYSIKNAKDYQAAWMDAAGFPVDYAYKVNKNKGQVLRNQATALSTQVVRALAGPKIAKAGVDLTKANLDARGKQQRLVFNAQNQKIKVLNAQQQTQLRNADYVLKQLGITDKNLIIKARMREAGKGGGKPSSASTLRQATKMAEDFFYGVAPTKRADGTISKEGKAAVGYSKALARLVGSGLRTAEAIKILNSFYGPGEGGRPVTEKWIWRDSRIIVPGLNKKKSKKKK